MKKIHLILLCGLLFTATITTYAQSGVTGNLTWSIANDTLTISGSGDMPDYNVDEQPWARFQNSITAVVINYGVTAIGERAFQFCHNLKSVSIPSSVKTIGDRAFMDCSSLTLVVIPNSVTTIGASAFIRSGLTSVTIPHSVTTIGNFAFSETKLTSVTIEDGVPLIGLAMFQSCFELTSIAIPNSVTSIYSFFTPALSPKNKTFTNLA